MDGSQGNSQRCSGSGYEALKLERKMNAAENRRKDEEAVNYVVEDSIFTDLFKDRKYLIQLYQVIHPEDKDVTQEQLLYITIHNTIQSDVYHNISFQVGEKIIILAELQAAWTENIAAYILACLIEAYQGEIKRLGREIGRGKKMRLLKPELYLIYAGHRKVHLEYISLAEGFFGGQEIFLDAKVKVLYGNDGDDIISQYVFFMSVYGEQQKKFGSSWKAVAETIYICKSKNILKEYFEEREKEAWHIMLPVYSEKEMMMEYIKSVRQDAAKENAKETAIQLLREGLSAEQIARCSSALSVGEVKLLQEELL